jgi:DNA-binding transcriptional MerR regulator
MTQAATPVDPLQTLRSYRALAPWNVRDLSLLVGAVLEASAVSPTSAAAKARPSERTIRFYVSRGLVTPPEGRATAAIYSYRHFLQLLCVKVRQMEGVTLDVIAAEMQDLAGDVLERRAATALGPALPTPDRLPLRGASGLPRGRSGRAISGWLVRDAAKEPHGPTTWRRIPVARGLELHVDADHPLARVGPLEADVAEAVRQALAKLLPTAPA